MQSVYDWNVKGPKDLQAKQLTAASTAQRRRAFTPQRVGVLGFINRTSPSTAGIDMSSVYHPPHR
jgi:hypothetical protein